MINILELVQCLCEQQLEENPRLLLSLHNDTGYTSAVCQEAEELLIENLQALLLTAVEHSSNRLKLRLSRVKEEILISCCSDGNILPPVMLSQDVEWFLPLETLPGRTLVAQLDSDDEDFQRYMLSLAVPLNLSIQDTCVGTMPDTPDVIIRDLRKPDKVFSDTDVPVIIVRKASQITTDPASNSLWWPFFDSDFQVLINAYRLQNPLKVLVADDSKPSQVATQIMLERIGCKVWTADNGTIALSMAEQDNYDLLFLDERMPGLLGSQVAKQLSEGSSMNCTSTKVSLTGISDGEKIAELYQAGIQYYLRKPVTRLILEEFLKDWRINNVPMASQTSHFK